MNEEICIHTQKGISALCGCYKDINDDLFIVDRMAKYGGSFVKALAEAFYVADPKNFRKLKETFSEYWEQYKSNF